MLNETPNEAKQIKEYTSTRILEDSKDSEDDRLNPSQVEELISNLSNPDLFEQSFTILFNFFSSCPYTFSTTYIQILFEFLRPDLDFSSDFRSSIFELLNALFLCPENNEVLEIMANEPFYTLIWPYLDNLASAIQLEKWLIKTYNSAFQFAMQNGICEKFFSLLSEENEKTVYIFDFISSFARYSECYQDFSQLLSRVCDLTFAATSKDIVSAGILCLSEFSRKSINIFLQVLSNLKFQEFCSQLDENNIDLFSDMILFFDTLFQNPKCMYRYETLNQGIISILELFSMRNQGDNSSLVSCLLSLLNVAIIIVEKYTNKECDDSYLYHALHVFSLFVINPDIVRICLERNVHVYLFQIAFNADVSYSLHAEVFHSICTFISTSDLDEIQVFLELEFLQLVENQIELLLQCPNAAIDALEVICNMSSEVKDLLFENETIISQLHYIAEHPEGITNEDGYRDCSQHAADFLSIETADS